MLHIAIIKRVRVYLSSVYSLTKTDEQQLFFLSHAPDGDCKTLYIHTLHFRP